MPLYCYAQRPITDAARLANVKLAFDLMRAADLPEPSERPEDVILGDGKAILRLLYGIFSHYQYELGRGNPVSDLQEIAEDEGMVPGYVSEQQMA